mgnify:CR=1 FL=1
MIFKKNILLSKYIEKSFSSAVIPAYNNDLIHLCPYSLQDRYPLIRDFAFRFDEDDWATIVSYLVDNPRFNTLYNTKLLLSEYGIVSFEFAANDGATIDLSFQSIYDTFFEPHPCEDDYDGTVDQLELLCKLAKETIENFNYIDIGIRTVEASHPLSLTQRPDTNNYATPFFSKGFTFERFKDFLDRLEECVVNIPTVIDEFVKTQERNKQRH